MDHKWILKPKSGNEISDWKFTDKDGVEVHVNLNINFIMDPSITLEVCEVCKQERINGREPKNGCDEEMSRRILDE